MQIIADWWDTERERAPEGKLHFALINLINLIITCSFKEGSKTKKKK